MATESCNPAIANISTSRWKTQRVNILLQRRRGEYFTLNAMHCGKRREEAFYRDTHIFHDPAEQNELIVAARMATNHCHRRYTSSNIGDGFNSQQLHTVTDREGNRKPVLLRTCSHCFSPFHFIINYFVQISTRFITQILWNYLTSLLTIP